MTLGASNVSFGMPERASIGAAFLPMAITDGLTSAIMDARSPQLVRAVKAADLLTNRDPWGAAGSRRTAPGRQQRSGADRDMTQGALAQGTADPAGACPRRSALPARRHAGAGAARRHAVRRRELERHRDRLHLRRPRHLQEMQDPDHRRQRARVAARRPRVLARTSCGPAGGWPAGRSGHSRPADRGPAAGDPAEGGDGRSRPPGHPAPRRAEALPGAGRAVAGRPADRPGAGPGRRG